MINPFRDKNGNIIFSYKPLRDIVFIWPTPPPEKFSSSSLEIPQEFRGRHQDGTGTLLAIGSGYWSQDGKWHPTNPELKPGILVQYDNSVPWGLYIDGQDRRKHFIVVCTAQDICGIY